MSSAIEAIVRQVQQRIMKIEGAVLQLKAAYDVIKGQAHIKSPEEEIDEIPGRRIMFNLSGTQAFTAADAQQQGDPITFQVSQDGPYIMTAYPLVMWAPSTPANATNLGRFRPIYSWPLPAQEVTGDSIDLSWQFNDGGSQRNFQNEIANPMFSRPDLAVPLPKPIVFTPNSVIQFVPTYNAINFSGALSVPTTAGILRVTLLGYKIANL
jgi:hypothetical protein